jgi:hypothetical protein
MVVRLEVAAAFVLGMFAMPTVARGTPRVAVQPFGGPETEPYRRQVAKIVGRHGFRVVTSLPAVSGTSQYPGLAKEKRLSAFVVADADDRGERIVLSFLVWQGIDGSVIGRWEVAGPKKRMPARIAKEFWKRLGPAIGRAMAPPSDELKPAPPMRINAGPPPRSGPPRRKAGPRPAARRNRNAPMAVSI